VTAYDALHRVAKIKSGGRILVTIAVGGAGSYGAVGTTGWLDSVRPASAQKMDIVKRLGATPISYLEENVGERVGVANWQQARFRR